MNTTTIKRLNTLIKEYEKGNIVEEFDINKEIVLIGWIRSNRDSGNILFISFTDGSRLNSLQLVCKKNETVNFDELRTGRTGAAILVKGKIIITNDAQQKFEIFVSEGKILKQADENYPIQNKEHSLEFLRDVAHVRIRTNKFYSIMKLRSELAFSIHNFFHLNDFVYVNTPIITSNDAEGAGESFYVTTSDDNYNFFGNKNAALTVSGQLQAEAYAQAYKWVYTFGPTFRAEKSHTNKHLAEFWMVEPEIAFCDLGQLMFLIESFVKFVIKSVLKRCQEELAFLSKDLSYDLSIFLESIIKNEFAKIEYGQAIKVLQEAVNKGFDFEDKDIYFGKDLKTEHEVYIAEKLFNKPVFIYNYPEEIKAFYMKKNNDGKTVAACDLLIPRIGELVGGSQREDNYELLLKKTQTLGINSDELKWYLDLRRYGYYRSAGFGLGFERLIMLVTGVENIKDTIPFPRYHGSIKF